MSRRGELPVTFGRTAGDAARAALWLLLIGGGIVFFIERSLTRASTPLGAALLAAGVPPWVPLAVSLALVAAIAGLGYRQSLRSATRFTLTPEALEVGGPLGTYRFQRENVEAVASTATSALGIKVRNREQVVATHAGTPQQREWLQTQEPYGEWDYVFSRSELGKPAAEVAVAVNRVLGLAA